MNTRELPARLSIFETRWYKCSSAPSLFETKQKHRATAGTPLADLGSNTIEIEYDGGGNKLRKTVKQGSTTLYIQNYLGGIEYNSGHLEAVFHAEGRVYNTNVGTGNSTLAHLS